MARKVFYSFHYDNDITRVMVVRNRWVTQETQIASGVIDKADFETIERQGEQAIYRWIDSQLDGTSVTVVLIGAETLSRKYVQYEICESINRGNAIIGIHINNIKNFFGYVSTQGNIHATVGTYKDGSPVIFSSIADGIYDYTNNDGYNNLGNWVELAAKKHGK